MLILLEILILRLGRVLFNSVADLRSMRQLSKDGAIVSPRDAPPPKESRFEPTNEFSAEPRHTAEPSVSPVNGNLLTNIGVYCCCSPQHLVSPY